MVLEWIFFIYSFHNLFQKYPPPHPLLLHSTWHMLPMCQLHLPCALTHQCVLFIIYGHKYKQLGLNYEHADVIGVYKSYVWAHVVLMDWFVDDTCRVWGLKWMRRIGRNGNMCWRMRAVSVTTSAGGTECKWWYWCCGVATWWWCDSSIQPTHICYTYHLELLSTTGCCPVAAKYNKRWQKHSMTSYNCNNLRCLLTAASCARLDLKKRKPRMLLSMCVGVISAWESWHAVRYSIFSKLYSTNLAVVVRILMPWLQRKGKMSGREERLLTLSSKELDHPFSSISRQRSQVCCNLAQDQELQQTRRDIHQHGDWWSFLLWYRMMMIFR